MVNKCCICGVRCEGNGEYSFRYLNETVWLCGHHAQKVMDTIKGADPETWEE